MRLHQSALFIFAAALCMTAEAAASLKPEQYQASYLVSLLHFVQWPVPQVPADSKTFRICFTSRSAVYDTLHDAIAYGESWAKLWRKQIVAEVLPHPEASQGCHILYVDAEAAAQTWDSMTPPPGTLTVSDMKDFALNGGMVELRIGDGNLNFVFNQTRINAAGLVVSAALATLADRLEDERRQHLGNTRY